MKFAVYGFFFEQAFSFNSFNFEPQKYHLPFWDEVKVSKDKYHYNLTGCIETNETDANEFIFYMQPVLTFVQQQDVIIKVVQDENCVNDSYEADFERRGAGAPFSMYFDIQKEIVEKLYLKLIDKKDLCNMRGSSVFESEHNSEFRSLVYKVAEPFHMRRPCIEITYFLYFSGLEAFCKQFLKSYYPDIKIEKDAGRNIAKMLEKLNINYIQLYTADMNYNLKKKEFLKEDFLRLSLSTYSNLRNKLFHENIFVAETESSNIKDNNKYPKSKVRITDYEYYLRRLCNVVILKYIDIQNKKLDCSKWYTRFPLIR